MRGIVVDVPRGAQPAAALLALATGAVAAPVSGPRPLRFMLLGASLALAALAATIRLASRVPAAERLTHFAETHQPAGTMSMAAYQQSHLQGDKRHV